MIRQRTQQHIAWLLCAILTAWSAATAHAVDTELAAETEAAAEPAIAADDDAASPTEPVEATTLEEAPRVLITDAQRAEAKQVYDELFGDRERQVKSTPDPADDLAFATTLLEAVDTVDNNPAVQSLLLEKVYEAAIASPDGRETALEAIERLITVDPQRESLGLQRKREAYEQVFATARGDAKLDAGAELLDMLLAEADAKTKSGLDDEAMTAYREALKIATAIRSPLRDAVRKQIEQHNRRILMLRKAGQLKDRLKADPKDTAAATDLVMLYLLDLDSPIEARKYTFLLDDQTLVQNIRDASKDPTDIAPMRALAMGDWYSELAAKTGGTARWNLLKRAESYYQAFLDSDAEGELQRSKAEFALERTHKTLDALEKQLGPRVGLGGKVVEGDVALASRGATFHGEARYSENLLDGNATKYTGSTGFAYGNWPCEWVVELSDVYLIREIRMLLWDGTPRFYRYAIDVSKDGKHFDTLVDQTGENVKPQSWQQLKIRPRPIKFIRIRGTYNSANSGFHVVELEAYCDPPRGKPVSTGGD